MGNVQAISNRGPRVLRMLLVVITLALTGFAALLAESPAKPVLSFSLMATNQTFSRQLEHDLSLRVERDALGWEVGVFRSRSTDNLLYPQKRWHGAYPCQLSAWSFRTQTFPNERVIAVRGLQHLVRIRPIDVTVVGNSNSERFAGGRIEIYWEPALKKRKKTNRRPASPTG